MIGEQTKIQPNIGSEPLPELLGIKEAARVLHVHPNTLRNWEKDGLLSVIRIGRRGDRRYSKASIMQMLQLS